MKRDLDLIRAILMAVEANPDPQAWIDPEPSGYSTDQVSYHVMLMDQAGLVEGWDRSAIGVFRWSARNLTWLGHEGLEAARAEPVWQRARERLEASCEGSVFEVLREALVAAARERAFATDEHPGLRRPKG